jgi:hypothetical protein
VTNDTLNTAELRALAHREKRTGQAGGARAQSRGERAPGDGTEPDRLSSATGAGKAQCHSATGYASNTTPTAGAIWRCSS